MSNKKELPNIVMRDRDMKNVEKVVDREEQGVFPDEIPSSSSVSSPTKKDDDTLVRRGLSGAGCDEAEPVDSPETFMPLLEKIDNSFLEWKEKGLVTPEIKGAYISFKYDLLFCLKETKKDLDEVFYGVPQPEKLQEKYEEIWKKRFFGDENGK